MRWKMAAALAAVLLCSSGSRAESPLGSMPAYTTRERTPIPNAQAVLRSIWLPGLDDGYVPQGIAFLDGRLYISSYRSTDRNQDRGPCRVYAADAKTGAVLGHIDLPESCGHAGGLARAPAGRLLVSDTRALFEIELVAGQEGQLGRVLRTIKLGGGMKGSFVADDADGFWVGQYERNDSGKIYKFFWAALEKSELAPADAIGVIAAPIYAQGAAVDAAGNFWVMRSGSTLGELVQLDRGTGAVIARFPMPVGAEGISFEPDGALWTLSEAGSQRWNHWKAFHPLAFRFDPKRLQ